MKKILPLFLSLTLLLTACSENSSSSQQGTAQNDSSAADSINEKDPFDDSSSNSSGAEESSEYDPFAVSGDDEPSSVGSQPGSFNHGVKWEEGKELILDYAPTVSFRYFVDNSGETADFGLLLFVNGIRQPYRTEEEPENKTMHIFDVNQNEEKVQTIQFEPVVGEKGDEVLVEIVTMFHPDYIQKGASNYLFNHNISSIYPSKMAVTEETGLTEPKVCTEYEETPISDELRQQFNQTGAGGSSSTNGLDSSVYMETLKNDVFYTPQDRLEGKGDMKPFTLDDTVSLCMYGGGEPYKYRVSMYINHELVKGAFDGADYIDMTPSKDTICKKQIDLKKLNLSLNEYNHLYFIAAPLYTDDNYGERMVKKTDTVTLVNSNQE